MNTCPWKFHTGYLVEGLELLIRKVAYTKYGATWLVPWSNYNCNSAGQVGYLASCFVNPGFRLVSEQCSLVISAHPLIRGCEG
jgi:hypothetical protein